MIIVTITTLRTIDGVRVFRNRYGKSPPSSGSVSFSLSFSPSHGAHGAVELVAGERKLIVVILVAALIEWKTSRILINRSSGVSG